MGRPPTFSHKTIPVANHVLTNKVKHNIDLLEVGTIFSFYRNNDSTDDDNHIPPPLTRCVSTYGREEMDLLDYHPYYVIATDIEPQMTAFNNEHRTIAFKKYNPFITTQCMNDNCVCCPYNSVILTTDGCLREVETYTITEQLSTLTIYERYDNPPNLSVIDYPEHTRLCELYYNSIDNMDEIYSFTEYEKDNTLKINNDINDAYMYYQRLHFFYYLVCKTN